MGLVVPQDSNSKEMGLVVLQDSNLFTKLFPLVMYALLNTCSTFRYSRASIDKHWNQTPREVMDEVLDYIRVHITQYCDVSLIYVTI
ncbi:hypothetical protein FRX31_018879 [Thalictrum thalictroides]|uniref:Uncharacterized protein n=1 Tax=Thalictrum thalictroides TaxID=46969 RepID=A0A7J6W366_THATH|nr:hypothetical protein FRX31_018879 [Thalictrum thalictroides]